MSAPLRIPRRTAFAPGAGFALLLLILCAAAAVPSRAIASAGEWYDSLVFEDGAYSFEFFRSLGLAGSGGADIGECLATGRAIEEGNDRSWYEAWKETADRVRSLAEQSAGGGHAVSARAAWLRASNYYRAAGFFLRDSEGLPLALETSRLGRESFQKAAAGMEWIEMVAIPYESISLPGYFCRAGKGKAPLVIVHTGFDGTREDLYFSVAVDALQRGYHVLLFDGPGQGEMIREQSIPYRHDWEKVVTPVVDYALTRKEVDADRIVLMGISMGGYLAPRAAAFEHRLAACIANGGIFDASAPLLESLPPELVDALDRDPASFDRAIGEVMKENAFLRWYFGNGLWTFAADSPSDFVRKLQKYTLQGVVDGIECPLLVVDSEADTMTAGEAGKLYDSLNGKKGYLLFTRAMDAQAHCQAGATAISNAMIFDWLDGTLGR